MIKVKKSIHKGYEEFLRANKEGYKIRQLFGKWHYIFSSEKGEISLVLLKDYGFKYGEDLWEIYELSNNKLFEDVERFKTKKEAEKRIRKLLE